MRKKIIINFKKRKAFFLKVSLKLLKMKPLVDLELMIHEQDTETPHPGCMVLGTYLSKSKLGSLICKMDQD